ncbi:MAG: hypothetical protein ACLSFT_09185 [Ruminococcus callidus]
MACRESDVIKEETTEQSLYDQFDNLHPAKQRLSLLGDYLRRTDLRRRRSRKLRFADVIFSDFA